MIEYKSSRSGTGQHVFFDGEISGYLAFRSFRGLSEDSKSGPALSMANTTRYFDDLAEAKQYIGHVYKIYKHRMESA